MQILLASYLKLLYKANKLQSVCMCFEIRANSYSRLNMQTSCTRLILVNKHYIHWLIKNMTFTGNTINVIISGKGLASTVALALAKSFYDNIYK